MSDDKELPPSEKKLQKALDESQDQQSDEVNSVASLLVLGGAFYALVPMLAPTVASLVRLDPLQLTRTDQLKFAIMANLLPLLQLAEFAGATLLGVAFAAGLLGNLLNRRRPPAPKMPELSYNPLDTAKNMFKPSQLIATLRLWLIAVLCICAVAYLVLTNLPTAVFGVYATDDSAMALAQRLPWSVVPLVFCVVVFSAILDAIRRKTDFIKQNRMDQEEVKKENKEDNGDPMIKSKRMELAREQ